MTYKFTITDSFNRSEDIILKQALEIAREEIEEQELDPSLTPKLVKFEVEGNKRIYLFTLMAQGNISADEDTSKKDKSTRKTGGIAASP